MQHLTWNEFVKVTYDIGKKKIPGYTYSRAMSDASVIRKQGRQTKSAIMRQLKQTKNNISTKKNKKKLTINFENTLVDDDESDFDYNNDEEILQLLSKLKNKKQNKQNKIQNKQNKIQDKQNKQNKIQNKRQNKRQNTKQIYKDDNNDDTETSEENEIIENYENDIE